MVCPQCQKFGKEERQEKKTIPIPINVVERLEKREQKLKEKDIFEGKEEETLVEDYSQKIRNARNRMNLTIDDLGKKINEKRTIIAKIESGEMIPTDELVKKLERALNIKLMEKPEDVRLANQNKNVLTIGDLINIKKVKK